MDLALLGPDLVLWTSQQKDTANYFDLIEFDRRAKAARVVIRNISATFAVTNDGVVFSKHRITDHLLRMPLETLAIEDTGVVISSDFLTEVPAIRIVDKFVATCDGVGLLLVPIAGGPTIHEKLPASCIDIAVEKDERLFLARGVPTPPGEPIVTIYNLRTRAVERTLSLPTGHWQATTLAIDDRCVYLAAIDESFDGAIFRIAR